jgi:hypothetical protein
MKKCANFMILPEFRLILECCKGKVSVEDAIMMKQDEISDTLYDPNYNIIVDIREFETSIDSTISNPILRFYNFLKELDIKSKVALLTTKPHQVVFSEILKRLSQDSLTIDIEIFSSPEAAIDFIGFSFNNFDLIKNKITVLNENTE